MRRSSFNPRPVRGFPVLNFFGALAFVILAVVFVVAAINTVLISALTP